MSRQIFTFSLLLQSWLVICAVTNAHSSALAANVENDVTDLSSHPCRRICKGDGVPMTCQYTFTIEQYSTMSQACYDCPNNVTDCFYPDCVIADGIKKSIIVANKQFPGPTIEVCKGDRIVVDVKNNMATESTSIHWHGMRQRGTPFMDGVPSVTQCPILPGQTFRYNFLADSAGTLLWHSHSFEQRADGLFGGLIIREPVDNSLYDIDEHLIVLTEWTERAASDGYALDLFGDIDDGPYNILVNGQGRYPTSSPQIPLATFEVEKGKKYRFRIINGGSQDCPMLLAIDNHEITAISSDGHDLEPVKVDAIRLLSGERYDIIIEANQKVDNYWIRVKGVDGNECERKQIQQLSVLRYKGASNSDPIPSATYNSFPATQRQLNPYDKGLDDELSLISRSTFLPDDAANTREPDHQFYISYNSYAVNQDKFIDSTKESGRYREVPGLNQRTIWRLNNINFVLPSVPLLTQSDMIDPNQLCNSSTVGDCFSKFCDCTHVLQAKLDSVVELIIVDEGFAKLNHPMHLHGNHFRVVGMGHIEGTATVDRIKQLDKEGKIPRKLSGALMKDTIMVPFNGYTIVRFHADNPGYWLFHCHFERHAHVGMALLFKVGEVKDFPEVPKDFPRC